MAIVLPKLSRIRTSARSQPDAAPAVTLELCREDGRYIAGTPLMARWRLDESVYRDVTGVEASVLWLTQGKGDEDLHVHHFERWSDNQLLSLDPTQPVRLQCQLPYSPVSYEGTLLRIKWYVRLRVYHSSGREWLMQQPFQLIGGFEAVRDADSP